MLPEIRIGSFHIDTLIIALIIAVLVMLGMTVLTVRRLPKNGINEYRYILPKIAVGFIGMVFGAAIYDAFFNYLETGTLYPQGVAFYGGLIGGFGTVFVLMLATPAMTSYGKAEWLDMLAIPFASAHFIGRIGCFFAGCCYGKETSGFGVVFPDRPAEGIIHGGVKCHPTQLYEAFAILCIVLLLMLVFKKHRFSVYLAMYAVCRFGIEFLRGDDRGKYLLGLSPAQLTSVVILVILAAVWIPRLIKKQRK